MSTEPNRAFEFFCPQHVGKSGEIVCRINTEDRGRAAETARHFDYNTYYALEPQLA